MRRAAFALVALLVAAPATADVRPAGYAECGGAAPGVTACTTRLHLRTTDVAHGFRLTSAYTGTLESRLRWGLGTRMFRCSYVASVRQGCVELGAWPLPGAVYRHECVSNNLNSTTPGGSGAWTCFTAHATIVPDPLDPVAAASHRGAV